MRRSGIVGAIAIALGCGDGGRPGASASNDAGDDLPSTTTTSATGGGSGDSGGGSGGMTSAATTGADTTTTADGSDGAEGAIFDVASMPDAGGDNCDGGGVQFSYIWISNSPQGTVSKINTETRIEEGRYTTGPLNAQDPSRTSVNLDGDVAVVNRMGGISKIWAQPEDCPDTSGNGQVDTSTGPGDIKAWGMDECVAWNTPLPSASRPAAWTTGDPSGMDGCGNTVYVDAKVWTSAPDPGNFADAIVYLLDGETGAIEDMVTVPGANAGLGIYGGAVDPDNDFWGVTYSAGPLVHVRIADMSYETIALPNPSAYGFTVDSKGRSWVGGWDGVLQRYDPADQSWTTVPMPGTYTCLSRGMMEDQNGELWAAALGFGMDQGLLRVDTDSATYVDLVGAATLQGVGTPTGASIDVAGKVWLVDQSNQGGGAFVYDPLTDTAEWVGGLMGPYTYSDMTGWALANVANPSG